MAEPLLLHAVTFAERPLPPDLLPTGCQAIEAAALRGVCSPAPDPDEELSDPDAVAALALRHDAIVRRLFSQAPVLPIRFGTALTPDAVRQLLASQGPRLSDALLDLAGASEWGLKASADADAARAAAEARSPRIQAIDADLAVSSAGRRYLLSRQRETALSEETHSLLEENLGQVVDALDAHARGSLLLPAPPGQPEFVLNAAFLVDAAQQRAFDETFDRLAADQRSKGVSLQLSGPWPPYNFVQLDLSEGADEPVDP